MAPTPREVIGAHQLGGTPCTVTTGAGTQAGDTLIILTGYNYYTLSHMNAPTIAGETVVNTGVVADAGTNAPHMRLHTCVLASGGAKTVSYSVTSDANQTMIVAVLPGSCSLDGTAGTGASATATTSHTLSAATPATADTLLIGSVVRLFGGTTEHWTAPSGMTDLLEILHSGGGQAYADQTLTAPGSTGTRTFALDPVGGGRTYAGILAAIKTDGGSGDVAAAITLGASVVGTRSDSAAAAGTTALSATVVGSLGGLAFLQQDLTAAITTDRHSATVTPDRYDGTIYPWGRS